MTDKEEKPAADRPDTEADTAEKGVTSKLDEIIKKVMINPIVLEQFAESLPARDLLSLRQTRTDWNSSFIPELRKKHRPIKLNGSPAGKSSLGKFVDDMRSSEKIPFAKYNLVNCSKSLDGFGFVCGATVTDLKIHWLWGEDWENSEVHRAIFEQMPQLTNLELWFTGQWKPEGDGHHGEKTSKADLLQESSPGNQLSPKELLLKRFHFVLTNQEDPLPCASVIATLIQRATKLERLHLEGRSFGPVGYDNCPAFLQATLTQMSESNLNISKLKQLDIGDVSRLILEILLDLVDRKKKALALETFSLSVTDDDTWEREEGSRMKGILKTILAHLAPTLKELTLWIHKPTAMVEIVLPRLEQLETLLVIERDSIDLINWNIRCGIDDDTFTDSFPSLKKLGYFFNYRSPFLDVPYEIPDISHPRVTNLSVETLAGLVYTLPTRFPLVTRLDLDLVPELSQDNYVHPETYAFLWGMWPALTHLKLKINLRRGGLTPDEFLTGVPTREMSLLKMELNNLAPKDDYSIRHLVNQYRSRAAVHELSSLDEFELDWRSFSDNGIEWGEVTDIGAYCGLALIGRQFRKLVINGFVKNLISQDCLEFMKNQFDPEATINVDLECRASVYDLWFT